MNSSNPKITDIQINLGEASFDFADTVFADLATNNGNPLSFGYVGVDPAGAGFFDPKMTLTAFFGTNKFTLADAEGKPNFFIGNFSIWPGGIAGVIVAWRMSRYDRRPNRQQVRAGTGSLRPT